MANPNAQEKLEQKLLEMRDKDETVTLMSRDKTVCEITVQQAQISHWLQAQIFKDINREKLRYYFGMFETVPLQELTKYVKYKNGRKTQPPEPPIESYDITKLTNDPQDGQWISSLTPKVVFEMLKIAGILEIPGLIGLIQCRIACWCKNRTAEEINHIFSELNYDKMPPNQEIPFD
eukprot:71739_1